MSILDPTSIQRRSPIYRRHQRSGALFKQFGDNFLVGNYNDSKTISHEYDKALALGICDLSTLPRVGFKGVGAPTWLAAQNIRLPIDPNTAVLQKSGALIAKLSEYEMLILSDLFALSKEFQNLSSKAATELQDYSQNTYILPRSDSHCWFAVTGIKASEMFSKICGVDLRAHKFPQGSIAQTSVAKTNCVIIRNDLGKTPSFYILGDISGSEFLWDCLLDAMSEHGGVPVGIIALHQLLKHE
jgi:sarcosine oxidase subunit gamma